VVLTFETALPYEDKRQSTIGVFRHYFDYIKHAVNKNQFIASFVGFTPTGEIPFDDLRAMMNWNHILLKPNFATQAEMDAFWRAVGYTGMRALAQVRPAVWLEAAPILALQDHRDVILCYEVDVKSRTAAPYQPDVVLKRGTRLKVSLAETARLGTDVYHRVLECEAEPRAQDLFVRKSDSLEITQEKKPVYVLAKKTVTLYRLDGLDDSGLPRFKRTRVKLDAGSKIQVSSLHKLTQADAGNGIVSAGGKKNYHLIVDPVYPSALGLFVRTNVVKAAS
jgi:hypothetical protein